GPAPARPDAAAGAARRAGGSRADRQRAALPPHPGRARPGARPRGARERVHRPLSDEGASFPAPAPTTGEMALYSIPEPREHWVGLYRSTLERGALHRGRAAEPAACPLELLAEATVNVCVLAASCAAIDAPDVYPPGLAADVLVGAEHGA